MARMVRLFLLLTALMMLCFNGAVSAERKSLEIVNNTGYPIKCLYIRASSTKDWGDDFVGMAPLKNGASLKLKYNTDTRFHKLKIVFMNNVTREWTNDSKLDLQGAWRLTIYTNGKVNNREQFAVRKN